MTAATAAPVVDGGRLLERLGLLARIGATPSGGVTRQAYGAGDLEARALVAGWMAAAGLEPAVDPAANLVGRRAGRLGGGRCLATGSHLDTVVEAGPLDGAYGVVAAVEVAAALARSDSPLDHDLVVVAFANEEGARGTDGMVGSRALVGEVSAGELTAADDDGIDLADRLAGAGGHPGDLDRARWPPASVAAFVELHVEQGPVLDAGGQHLGIVTAIAGRQSVDIVVTGNANHAGTTPMELRHDALAAAAEIVLAVEALALGGAVGVATCGYLQGSPNVRNVIPGLVQLSAELRDTDADRLAAVRSLLGDTVQAIAARRRVTASVSWGQLVRPVATDPTVLDAIEHAARRSARPWRRLASGAGHDAQILAPHLPAGMIFVPSVAGISHAPAERTDADHLVAGAQLLADAIVHLDRRLARALPGSPA